MLVWQQRTVAAGLVGGMVAILLQINGATPQTLFAAKTEQAGTYRFISQIGENAIGDKRSQFLFPHGVSVGPDDRIYIADTNNHRILSFDIKGKLVKEWGDFGIETRRLNSPFGVFVDPKGLVYVADSGNSRIQVFKSDGTFLKTWGGEGHEPGKMMDPLIGIAMDAAGN